MLCFILEFWGFTSAWHPLFQLPNSSPFSNWKKKIRIVLIILHIKNSLWKVRFLQIVIDCSTYKIQWFPLRMLIVGQKSCFLEPPFLELHNRNDINIMPSKFWYLYFLLFLLFQPTVWWGGRGWNWWKTKSSCCCQSCSRYDFCPIQVFKEVCNRAVTYLSALARKSRVNS